MDFLGKEIAQYDLDLTNASIATIYNNTESILFPAPHQEMLELYLDFNDVDRMLAVWPTGSGKTIGSLRVAKRFIDNSAKSNALKWNARSKASGVKIIGFTRDIFVKELISFPEFGIVTFEDVERTKALKAAGDQEEYLKHIYALARRVSDRDANGYFDFFGNKALFQQLFMDTTYGKPPTVTSLAELNKMIMEKKVVVTKLIDAFQDSFLICDEIHNVYNRRDNNSWGIALSYILDNTNAKALFISATPISNSQSEIVSVVNLLASKGRKYELQDFFKDGVLTEKGREIITKETKGKISYLKNTNANDFPSWSFAGKETADIFGLKFVRVPISKDHLEIYKKTGVEVESQEDELAGETEGEVFGGSPYPPHENFGGIGSSTEWANNGYASALKQLYGISTLNGGSYGSFSEEEEEDFVIVDEENLHEGTSFGGKIFSSEDDDGEDTRGRGINSGFRNDLYLKTPESSIENPVPGEEPGEGTGDDAGGGVVINTMKELKDLKMTSAESQEAGFYYSKTMGIGINPDFDIQTFAPKYYQLIKDLGGGGIPEQASHGSTGKRIVYHNNVKNNGIFFISQILDNAGFVKFGTSPRDESICFRCGATRAEHSNKNVYSYINSLEDLKKALKTKPSLKVRVEAENADLVKAVKKKLGEPIELPSVGSSLEGYLTFQLDEETGCFSFSPRRYVMIWSDPSVDTNKILDVYNSADNSTGINIEIVLGSKKIKESLDFKGIRKIHIMSRPPSISMLIQIIGRGIRNKSHDQLPKSERNVEIFIYVHYVGPNFLLDELAAYKDRMGRYLQFKELEKLLYINSINAFTYPDMEDPKVAVKVYKQVLDTYVLEKKKFNSEPSVSKYELLYTKMEIDKVKKILKSLFVEKSLWSYQELLSAVIQWSKDHYWNTNTKYIAKENVDAALMELVYSQNADFIDVENEKFNTTFRSINSGGKLIVIDKKEFNIVPFTLEGEQFFKLQRVESLVELTPLNMFTDITDVPNVLEYSEFSIALADLRSRFDPERFLLDNSVEEIVEAVDELIESEQATLLVHIVNTLRVFSPAPKKLGAAMFQKIGKVVFFLVFTGLFVVNFSPEKAGTKNLEVLKNVTNKIFEIPPGVSTALPVKYHPVSAEVEAYLKKKGTLDGLLEPIRVVQRKPLVYKNGYLEESQYIENVSNKENDIVVGYMERDSKTGKKVFKLREPVHSAKGKVDTRKIQKGSFYMNIPEVRLRDYIKALDSKMDLSIFTTKGAIGEQLKVMLKQLDKNSTDGTRYFYW